MKRTTVCTATLVALMFLPGPPRAEAQTTDALFIDTAGDVGIGTMTPGAGLHVWRDDNSALTVLRVENANAGAAAGTRFEVAGAGQTWLFDVNTAGNFSFNKQSVLGVEFLLRGANDPGGLATLTVDGSISADNVTFSSSRELKTGFAPVDPGEVLEKVAGLEVQSWRFKQDGGGVRHVGPMAEDFHAAFALGNDERQISVVDLHGVALAAIQGLNRRLDDLEAENAELRAELRELRSRLVERPAGE